MLEQGVKNTNDNLPKLSQMQIDLLVHSLVCDWTRVATLQYTNSVGQARMRWLGIDESHHELSHDPDSKIESQEKLTKINKWYCEQVAYLVRKLAETPEPGWRRHVVGPYRGRLDERAGQRQLAYAQRHSVRDRGQRSRDFAWDGRCNTTMSRIIAC